MRQTAKKRKPLWLKVVIGLCLLIVTLLWVPDIYFQGFTDTDACRDERGFFSKLVCGISASYEGYAQYSRSLPSDEEMVTNFHKHRADFEALVKIYREDLSVATELYCLRPTSEIKIMMNRINVGSVCGDGRVWMPHDPYSRDPNFLKKQFAVKPLSPEGRKLPGVLFTYRHGKVRSLRWAGVAIHRKYYIQKTVNPGPSLLRKA